MAAKYNEDEVYLNDLYRGQEVTVPEFDQFIGHVSYGLYLLACDIIGDEGVIRDRRQVTDLWNEFSRLLCSKANTEWYPYLSGSISEGFRLSSSDIDYMCIHRHVEVINSITQYHQYDDNMTVLLMESDKTRPGFVLLRLVGNAYHLDIQRSRVSYPSETYVSSQLWREENPCRKESEIIHGPCNSGRLLLTEYDRAYCLHSSQWPRAAYGSIERLLRRKWPPLEVVQDIVTSGVHFVPISAKQSRYEFVEWRLSFSATENKLIHAMNHTQSMCYGLLKIFLKEAINTVEEIDSILCSYYLKTAVFWVILDSTVQWVPNKLIKCFWQCLCKILNWVDNEYLPNFFIPENNMLIEKIQPGQKKRLMDHLSMLHSEGYACLLRCPSLRRDMDNIIHRPITVYILESYIQMNQKSRRDIGLFAEFYHFLPPIQKTIECQLPVLQTLNDLLRTNSDPFNDQILGIWWRYHIGHYAALYHATISNSCSISNKELYRIETKLLKTINRCGMDSVCHYIEIALCLYRRGRYEHVIKIIQQVKVRLQNPYLMYIDTRNVDCYKAAGGDDLSYLAMCRRNFAFLIHLVPTMSIPELRLEHQSAEHLDHLHNRVQQTTEDREGHMYSPPQVTSFFLECLSYYHLGHHQLVQNIVSDLYTLVHKDDGYHICEPLRAISWHILGICQERIRDYHGAYQSYSNALHEKYSNIRRASQRRLSNLM